MKRTDSIIIEEAEGKEIEKANNKKIPTRNIVVAVIIIVLWLLSYLNIFDVGEYLPEGMTGAFNSTSGLKKGKKERFSNRKKVSN